MLKLLIILIWGVGVTLGKKASPWHACRKYNQHGILNDSPCGDMVRRPSTFLLTANLNTLCWFGVLVGIIHKMKHLKLCKWNFYEECIITIFVQNFRTICYHHMSHKPTGRHDIDIFFLCFVGRRHLSLGVCCSYLEFPICINTMKQSKLCQWHFYEDGTANVFVQNHRTII